MAELNDFFRKRSLWHALCVILLVAAPPSFAEKDDFISNLKIDPDSAEMFYDACVSESGIKELEASTYALLSKRSPELSAEQLGTASERLVIMQCGHALINANQIGFKVTFGHVPEKLGVNEKEAKGAMLIFLGCNGKESKLLTIDPEIKTDKQKWIACGQAMRILLRSGHTFDVDHLNLDARARRLG